MFNSLTGTITGKFPSQLYLDIHGMEWDITVPDTSLDALPPVGSTARVFTWMYHREDQMKLFGFASPEERAVFADLMKVEGVGPKAAVRILSGIGARALGVALDSEDVSALEKLPGVGKKTAQKMILALKGKLALADSAPPKAKSSRWQDVTEALVSMGFDRKAAEDAVAQLSPTLDSSLGSKEQEAALLRLAIVQLST